MLRSLPPCAAALCVLSTSHAGAALSQGVGAASSCAAAGCFSATLTGGATRSLQGSARFGVAKGGALSIVLLADERRGVVTLARDAAVSPGVYRVAGAECDFDEDSTAASGEAFIGRVHSLKGGALEWVAGAGSGTITIKSVGPTRVTGTFALKACGEMIDSDDELEVALSGSFDARAFRLTPAARRTAGVVKP